MERVWRLLPVLIAVICLSACGRTAERSREASPAEPSHYEEISFSIDICGPDAVTYTICSAKEQFLFYEERQFAYVEQYVDGGWYPLVQRSSASDLVFRGASIPTEETTETISIHTLYGGRLARGNYRLVVPCYGSLEDLWFRTKNPVYIAAEFEII